MKPMEDKEFVAQLAQFSSLEQMQGINENFMKFMENNTSFMQANSAFGSLNLVGQYVEAVNPKDTTKNILGQIERVSFESGTPVLIMKGHKDGIPMGYISSVFKDLTTGAQSLVNRNVTIADPLDPNQTQTLKVLEVKTVEDKIMLKLEDRENLVPLSDIKSIPNS